MAKRIVIFEDSPSGVTQILSDQFQYSSIREFSELLLFIGVEKVDLLVIKEAITFLQLSQILNLRREKLKNPFAMAYCLDPNMGNPKNTYAFKDLFVPRFNLPRSKEEWANLCQLIISNYSHQYESEKKLQKELVFQKRRNDRLDRELSLAYFINFEKLKELKKILGEVEEVEFLERETLYPRLFVLKNQINRLLRLDKVWKKFVQQFELVCPSFIKSLTSKHPNLSQNDLRLCVYLKIGTSNKEISLISNVNEGSVRKTLNRMKKKMALGKEDNLRVYILNIEN